MLKNSDPQTPLLSPLPVILQLIQPIDFFHKLGICERIFGEKLAANGICWIQTGSSIPWKLDLANPTHRWIVYGKYEGASFLDWARKFLPPDAIVVDSGANIGQMLMYLAQWIPQGKVLAFEPGTEAGNWLQECLAVNANLPVEIIRAGLGASTAQLRLNQIGGNVGHGAWSQVSETEGEAIQIVRLADELTRRSISKVNLWKLDVEGYELSALKGAEELLREQRIEALYVELGFDQGKQICEYLSQFGYVCHLFDQNNQLYCPTELPDHTNGLFLPK